MCPGVRGGLGRCDECGGAEALPHRRRLGLERVGEVRAPGGLWLSTLSPSLSTVSFLQLVLCRTRTAEHLP